MEKVNTWNKTETQIQRAASARIKKYVADYNFSTGAHLQYYFVRGLFHINNIDFINTAKSICEAATGLKFKHFTNSMCKIDFEAEEVIKEKLKAIFEEDEQNYKLLN
jgi:hypothetical protein